MNTYKYLLCALLFYSIKVTAYTGMPEPMTTRTISSAGAGVASLTLNEAPLLNPAAVVFFNKSSLYYQRTDESLNDKSSNRTTEYKTGRTDIVTIIDNSSSINGGFSYQKQNLASGERTRYSASLASSISNATGLGFILRRTEENSDVVNDEVYNQLVVGLTHIYSEDLILGFTTVDPSQNHSEYFTYTFGVHYTLNKFIDVIVDAGSGDVQNREEAAFNMWALQLRSFDDIYLRYGRFHNLHTNKKGIAWGISWVGPKVSFEYANKSSELISSTADTILNNEIIFESSFNFVVVF